MDNYCQPREKPLKNAQVPEKHLEVRREARRARVVGRVRLRVRVRVRAHHVRERVHVSALFAARALRVPGPWLVRRHLARWAVRWAGVGAGAGAGGGGGGGSSGRGARALRLCLRLLREARTLALRGVRRRRGARGRDASCAREAVRVHVQKHRVLCASVLVAAAERTTPVVLSV